MTLRWHRGVVTMPGASRGRSLGVYAAGVLGVYAAWLLWTAPQAFPYGDVAVIEIATLAALRDGVALGPYSQFGWHHPGPLLFYLLAPFYALTGFKSIGMAAGALALNLGAVSAAGWAILRHSSLATTSTALIVIGLYMLRAGDLGSSAWNAHLVVLPVAALTVLAAAASLGDGAALLAATVVASFVAQSSVSVAPYAVVVLGVGAALGLRHPNHGDGHASGTASRGRWLVVALVVGVVLWLPPLTEQATHRPGNLLRLWQFFVADSRSGQPWDTALLAWGDMTTAFVRSGFELPWGQAYEARGSWPLTAAAAGQLLLLVPMAVWSARHGHAVVARLCLFTVLGSVVAGWSITRIAGSIGDYQIFWISVIGALSLAALASTLVASVAVGAEDGRRWVAPVITVAMIAPASLAMVRGLTAARDYAITQQEQDAPRRVVALATAEYIERERVRRPAFRMNAVTWLQAASVVLHVYRGHAQVAVDRSWVPVFGAALAPDGSEDLELEIGGGCAPGRRVVAQADGLCVFEPGPGR